MISISFSLKCAIWKFFHLNPILYGTRKVRYMRANFLNILRKIVDQIPSCAGYISVYVDVCMCFHPNGKKKFIIPSSFLMTSIMLRARYNYTTIDVLKLRKIKIKKKSKAHPFCHAHTLNAQHTTPPQEIKVITLFIQKDAICELSAFAFIFV